MRTAGGRLLLGTNWAADGFCLSFKDTLFHTHLLCLYGDLAFTVPLYFLLRGNQRSELQDLQKGLASTPMHGFAHAYLWYETHYRGKTYLPGQVFVAGDSSLGEVALAAVILIVFWGSFLLPLWSRPAAAVQVLVHTLVLMCGVPLLLAFTYVNTALNINFTMRALLTETHRDVYYALQMLLVLVP